MTGKEKNLLALAIKGLTDDEPLTDYSSGTPKITYPDGYIGWERAMEILCELRDKK